MEDTGWARGGCAGVERALGGDPEVLEGSRRGLALILKAPGSQKQVQNGGLCESSSYAS